MIRLMIASLIFAAAVLHAGRAAAQGVSAAPPWHSGAPPAGAPPNECMKEFFPLREEAEKRGKLIKAAGERRASPEEACKLIGSFGQAEMKIIRYIEANAARCGFPQRIADQLKSGHRNTEALARKVCAAARRPQWRGPPPVGPGDFEIRPLPVAVTG